MHEKVEQTHILSLETTDGHLSNVPLEFDRGLNCVIGARGTCKSTIVETIRFLFDDDKKRVEALLADGEEAARTAHGGLIRATLKGGTARLEMGTAASNGLAKERGPILERDVTSATRVYLDGVKAVEDEQLLSGIEIYSQGELQEVAMEPAKRLALVDRPHKAEIDSWSKESAASAGEIAALGPRIRELRAVIASAEKTLREGEETRSALSAARAKRPSMSAEMAASRARFQERERLQTRAASLVDEYRAIEDEIRSAASRFKALEPEMGNLARAESAALQRVGALMAGSLEASQALVANLAERDLVAEALREAQVEFDAESESYSRVLRAEEAVTEAVRHEDRLATEVETLDRISRERDERKAQLENLLRERDEKRQEHRDLRTRIFQRRLAEVDRINSEFSKVILLTLNHGTHNNRYRDKLDELLSGSRLRERPELCRQISSTVPPDRLVSFVEDDDAEGLAAILNRDSGQMMRLISHLGDTQMFYQLETVTAEDSLDVTMYVDESARSVDEMSNGQKATAILPLVLRDAPYPLVLDQPEDDLDNHFIYSTLAKTIESLKRRRQLIFVTHNANIPVVGDADAVFVMSMQGLERAGLDRRGTVDETRDEIIGLLEGGREAFELRSRMYGYDDRQ